MTLDRIGFPTFMMCSNTSYNKMVDRVEAAGMEVDTIIENVGSLLNQEAAAAGERNRIKRQTPTMNWDDYQR